MLSCLVLGQTLPREVDCRYEGLVSEDDVNAAKVYGVCVGIGSSGVSPTYRVPPHVWKIGDELTLSLTPDEAGSSGRASLESAQDTRTYSIAGSTKLRGAVRSIAPRPLEDVRTLISIRLIYTDAYPLCSQECIRDGMWGNVHAHASGGMNSSVAELMEESSYGKIRWSQEESRIVDVNMGVNAFSTITRTPTDVGCERYPHCCNPTRGWTFFFDCVEQEFDTDPDEHPEIFYESGSPAGVEMGCPNAEQALMEQVRPSERCAPCYE